MSPNHLLLKHCMLAAVLVLCIYICLQCIYIYMPAMVRELTEAVYGQGLNKNKSINILRRSFSQILTHNVSDKIHKLCTLNIGNIEKPKLNHKVLCHICTKRYGKCPMNVDLLKRKYFFYDCILKTILTSTFQSFVIYAV